MIFFQRNAISISFNVNPVRITYSINSFSVFQNLFHLNGGTTYNTESSV